MWINSFKIIMSMTCKVIYITVYYSCIVYTMWYLTKSDNMNNIYNFKIYDLSKTCQEFKQVIMWHNVNFVN